jgi:hypothetical protein
MMNTTAADLTCAIKLAVLQAATELFARHPGHYYYFSLITTGEAHAPVIAAWSDEALEEAVKNEVDKENAKWGLKWSYADSPFYCFGEDHFSEVNRLFSLRPIVYGLTDDKWKSEVILRMGAMEQAIAELDAQGLFGVGDTRRTIVVNVEVMPPDRSNTERAIRLNPPEAIEEWLREAAE